MDILASSGLEPQLAIPVIVVVLGALLVYVFGFQQTKEPSYEHLAVLQSSSSYKNRSLTLTSNKQKNSTLSGPIKPKANGHVVSDKDKNGVIKKGGNKTVEVNKENKPPQVKVQPKKEVTKVIKATANKDKPADFESGDWIQATSRKDKKKTIKKEDQTPASPSSSPPKSYYQQQQQQQMEPGSPRKQRAGSPTKPAIIFEDDAEEKTIVLKEMELFQKQSHSTQTSPAKTVVAAAPTPLQSAPQTEALPVTEKRSVKENAAPAPELKKEVKEKVKEGKVEAKTNIAFDEMGDTWEEAKSRGAKKRIRTRKD